jgi:hypothetical protein
LTNGATDRVAQRRIEDALDGCPARHDVVVVDAPAESDLLAEIEALRAENARLRGLLGLDDRAANDHVAAWSPTLFVKNYGADHSAAEAR